MKALFLTLLLFCSTTVIANDLKYVEQLQRFSYWGWIEKSQQLLYCFPVKRDGLPVCTPVPDKYVVIQMFAPAIKEKRMNQ